MKNPKEVMDSVADATNESMTNWVETAAKAQQNMFTPGGMQKNSELYQDWLNRQMNIFRKAGHETMNGTAQEKKEEKTEEKSNSFFQDWYTRQMEAFSKMNEFNKTMVDAWMQAGKSAQDHASDAGTWMNPFTQTWGNNFRAFSEMLNSTQRDSFNNMFMSQSVMKQMQDMFRMFSTAMQAGLLNRESAEGFFNGESFRKMTESMFGNLFPETQVKDLFNTYVKMVHEFFSMNQGYNTRAFESFQKAMKGFPDYAGGDYSKVLGIYNHAVESYTRMMEPVMKMVAPGKEQERMQAMIEMMDKMAVLSIKQNQLQYMIYQTAQKGMRQSFELVSEKFSKTEEMTSFKKFYSEWTSINEKAFTELFASDAYSALKAEVLSLGMKVKEAAELEFEYTFAQLPLVFRSEMNELYHTVNELRKQVRSLQERINLYEGAEPEAVVPSTKKSKSTK